MLLVSRESGSPLDHVPTGTPQEVNLMAGVPSGLTALVHELNTKTKTYIGEKINHSTYMYHAHICYNHFCYEITFENIKLMGS